MSSIACCCSATMPTPASWAGQRCTPVPSASCVARSKTSWTRASEPRKGAQFMAVTLSRLRHPEKAGAGLNIGAVRPGSGASAGAPRAALQGREVPCGPIGGGTVPQRRGQPPLPFEEGGDVDRQQLVIAAVAQGLACPAVIAARRTEVGEPQRGACFRHEIAEGAGADQRVEPPE